MPSAVRHHTVDVKVNHTIRITVRYQSDITVVCVTLCRVCLQCPHLVCPPYTVVKGRRCYVSSRRAVSHRVLVPSHALPAAPSPIAAASHHADEPNGNLDLSLRPDAPACRSITRLLHARCTCLALHLHARPQVSSTRFESASGATHASLPTLTAVFPCSRVA